MLGHTPIPDDPRNAAIASGKRAIQLATNAVQPPSPLYLQVEDSIYINIINPTQAGGMFGRVIARFLRPDGEIIGFKREFPCSLPGAATIFTLGEGWLLSLAVSIPGLSAPEPGYAFVFASVIRDTPEGNLFHWNLFADTYENNHVPSWPPGRMGFPQEGAGRLRTVVGSTPAAGADIAETVPNNVRWRLLCLFATLVTSAAGGNRAITLGFDDGANVFSENSATSGQGVSTTTSYSFSDNGGFQQSGVNPWNVAIPANLLLANSYRIRTFTVGIQAADQWSAPKYLVQEWVSA